MRSIVLFVLAAACGSAVGIDDAGTEVSTDGIDRAAAETKVRHAYRGVLGRDADEAGLAHYAERLATGTSSATFCGWLFDSEEFAANRAQLSEDALAAELYRGILERDGDDGGLAHTADEIAAGRAALRAGAMLDSDEFSERFLGSGAPPPSDPPPTTGGPDAARVVASTLPSSMRCNTTFYGSVTVQNTGTETWPAGGAVRLGIAPAAYDAGARFGSGDPARVGLGESVPPGGSATISFTYRAPSSEGAAPFAVQMVREMVHFFGQAASTEVSVQCGVPQQNGPLPPLGTDGPLFVANGQPVRLLGSVVCCVVVCCVDTSNGWPLVSNAYLDRMAAAGLNWTHVRTGPFVTGHEDPETIAHETDPATGAMDLSRYRPAYFDKLRGVISYAASRGIYVEVDLVDAWPFKHGISAFSAGRNIQGLPGSCDWFHMGPNAAVQQWVRKLVAETGEFSNVMYQIGNESFGCGASDEWEMGIFATVKDELARHGFPDRLVGSNAYSDYLPVDYIATHEQALPVVIDKPTIVNEFGLEQDDTDTMELALMALLRLDVGVYHMAWRGSLNQTAYERYLAELGQVRLGVINEPPSDYTCAEVDHIGLKVHNNPSPGAYVIDSTSKDSYNRPLGPEGSWRRLRCEAEQVDTDTEKGPRWEILSGSGDFAYNKNPYLFKVMPQTTMTVRACSRRFPNACGILAVDP
jgi:hypothetical protein